MTNVAARMVEAAARFPTRTAIELVRGDSVDATTYAALADRAGRVSADLASRGLGRGDRVAILGDNDAAWIAAYFGILRLGAVPVPLDTAYQSGQVHAVLDSSGAKLLLTTPRYLDTAQAAAHAAASGARPAVCLLTDAIAAGGANVPPLAEVDTEDTAVMLYTSGTTADPKGVVLTHANLDAERQAVFAIIEVTEEDAVLGVLPLFHALAQVANLLLPLAVGARVVFLESVSSSTLLGALQTRGVSLLACVPQFFYLIHQRVMGEVARASRLRRLLFRALLGLNVRLREAFGWNPGRRWFARVHRVLGPRMRILVTGGSTFDPGIGRDLYGLGFVLLNAYGLTETTGAATIGRPGDRFTSSVGQALPGVEIKTTSGEILIRGPVVMREYFNRPDATAAALKDGWLHTGDLGRLDDRGRLYITGRLKEIIVLSSGKNLYPEEIEAHYRRSPFIKEVCVLGLRRPDEPAAERLHAVVVLDADVLRERAIVNVKELVRFELEGLSVALPAHKRILSYDIWTDALPRTTTGKIRRHEVERRVLAAERTRDAPGLRALSDDEQRWLRDADRAVTMTALAERLDRPAAVRPNDNLELDLGLDSMERVELLTWLEQRQGSQVAPDVRATIFTVRHLLDAVAAAPIREARQTDAGGDERPWDVLLAAAPDPAIVANLRQSAPVRDTCYFVIIRTIGLLARIILRFRVTGTGNLPAAGAFVMSPNHQSFLDGFLLCAGLPRPILRRVFFVGDAPYFKTPRMRRLAESIHLVPVDPDAYLVSAMQAGAAGLRMGRILVLFPEGERTIDGEVKKFRKGAAILASHLNVPIVPVALDGLYTLWPRGRSFNWRELLSLRAKVSLEFGAPLPVGRDAAAGTAALREAVSAMLARSRAR